MKNKKIMCMYTFWLLLFFFLLLMFLEKNHILRCGVLDDLTLNQHYLNMNFFQATLVGGYKFRPVANAIMWIIFNITQGNLYVYGYINIIFAALCATIIYIFVLDCSKSYFASFIASMLYVFSRFSYYQITQQLGIMETTGTLFGICVVYTLYKFIETKKGKYYYTSLLMYFLASLSHERYLALFPVLVIVWLMVEFNTIKNKKNIRSFCKPISAILVFGCVLLLFNIFVSNIMTGTGGSDVTETSNIQSVLINLKKSIAYLFSINLDTTDMYLNMISWENYTSIIKTIVVLSNISILIMVVLYIVGFFSEEKESKGEQIKSITLYVLSIGALLLISSVTIRVELRWMYFPYIIMIFMLLYMVCKNNTKKCFKQIKTCAIVIYALATICFSMYCRDFYNNLYYWRLYTVGNDLIDETYGKYEEEMYNRSWVIISNVEELNSYEDMLNVYDPYNKYDLKLEVVKSIEELNNVENIQGKEILYFDADDLDFINVTNIYNGSSTQ